MCAQAGCGYRRLAARNSNAPRIRRTMSPGLSFATTWTISQPSCCNSSLRRMSFVLPAVAAMMLGDVFDGEHDLRPTHIEVVRRDAIPCCHRDLRGRPGKPAPMINSGSQLSFGRLRTGADQFQRVFQLPQAPRSAMPVGRFGDFSNLDFGCHEQSVQVCDRGALGFRRPMSYAVRCGVVTGIPPTTSTPRAGAAHRRCAGRVAVARSTKTIRRAGVRLPISSRAMRRSARDHSHRSMRRFDTSRGLDATAT